MIRMCATIMPGRRTVHVFSVIPRLSELVSDQLTDVEVVNLDLSDIAGKYEKKVTEKELVALQDAEILLVDNNLLAQMLGRLPNLLWVQGTWAGVENLIAACKDKPKPSYPVSRLATESFSQLMAEYTLGWIITHERRWLDCRQNQLASKWVHDGKIAYYQSIRDLIVGVMGMGIIGKEVARSLKCLRATVHAFTRTAPTQDNISQDVDKYRHTGELTQFLQECDYIVNIMPSTPDTRGMLGNDVLRHAKKDAVLINIGRGDVITEEDLIKALDSDWISAAILDVFVTEPVPSNSRLWLHPKVWITPHSAGVSRAQDVSQAFVTNFHRFINGQPVLHKINWDAGY